MDRISALRNVEDALAAFEAGERTLDELERDVRGIVRTYATDFDGELEAYRAGGDGAGGDGAVDGVVVVGSSPQAARERVRDLVERPGEFTIERVDDGD